ncbi:MAG TPA: D-alanyl-D-alanine carboxypeptidase family protein [Pyrinomonadaceae bacterium]|nr:D-alanyl-D-alanine carboxypeptidase family protein [Pyrinomonadaceae bacterium]
MKPFGFHLPLFLVLLAAMLGVVAFDESTSRGQSQSGSQTTESRVKPTSMVRERRAGVTEISNNSAALALAVTRNTQLRTELSWVLGGKQQRGWYLYRSLIDRLLGIQDDVTSEGFASALAQWQHKSGVEPTGILDEESFYAMVSQWQEDRLKDRTPAQPEQLVIALLSDFYDPTRLEELRQVERETYAAYKRMVAAAIADRSLGLASSAGGLSPEEKYLKIMSSFRTREYQEQLRRESPHAGRAGLAINSPHFTGRALDLYVGGDPVDTTDSNRAVQVQTPAYQWLVRNAERFGFRPYFYEPWHWEYVK